MSTPTSSESPQPRSNPAANLILLLVSVLLAFALCELGARIFLPTPKGVFVRKESEQQKYVDEARNNPVELALDVHPEQGGLYMETDKGRRLRPNAKVVIEEHMLSKRRIEIQTNELGYRHEPIGPKTKKRFLFLGDSVTLADYLPYEESFPALVASKATARGQEWEVINAGVGSISLENELAILLDTGLSVVPDVVVVNFYLNDFAASPGVYLPPVPKGIIWSRFLHYGFLVMTNYLASIQLEVKPVEEGVNLDAWQARLEARLDSEEGNYRENPKAFNALVIEHIRRWGGAWSEDAWLRMEPYFATMAELARKENFELKIVIHPVRYQVETQQIHDYPQAKLKEIGLKMGVPVLDLLPALRQAWKEKQSPLFFDHCHHTNRGSELVAHEIEAFLNAK